MPAGEGTASVSPLWQGIARADDAEPEPRDMLRDIYGSNARGGVDAKAAAEDLGVSERTVRRWAKDGIPSHAKGAGVRESHQQWRASPEGRQSAMNTRRESRLRSRGTTIRFKGRVKVSQEWRKRDIEFPISSEDAGDLLDALLAGNDEAALDIFADAMGDGFFGGDVAVADLDPSALETFK